MGQIQEGSNGTAGRQQSGTHLEQQAGAGGECMWDLGTLSAWNKTVSPLQEEGEKEEGDLNSARENCPPCIDPHTRSTSIYCCFP